jgi:general secretion pathway protein L
MPKLLLRLLSAARESEEGFELPVEWMLIEDDGAERSRGVTDQRGITDLLDPASPWQLDPDNIVVTAPSRHIFTLACEVPGRSAAQIRKALPFVIEEYLASDLDSVHLAYGEIRSGKPTLCHVVERRLLQGWCAALRSAGLEANLLIAESDLLPHVPDGAILLLEGTTALVKTDRETALVDRANLALALSSLEVGTLSVVGDALTPRERASLPLDIPVTESPLGFGTEPSAIGYLASRLGSNVPMANLLQGDFAPVRRSRESFRQWRWGGALAASWFVVAVLLNTVNAFSASRQADQLEAEAESLYRDIFPNARQVPNPRRQMQQALGEKSDAETLSLLEMFGRLASVVGGEFRIQRVDFLGEAGETAVDILVQSYDQLDQLKSTLGQDGVAAEIVSAEQQPQGVRARIRLVQAGERVPL